MGRTGPSPAQPHALRVHVWGLLTRHKCLHPYDITNERSIRGSTGPPLRAAPCSNCLARPPDRSHCSAETAMRATRSWRTLDYAEQWAARKDQAEEPRVDLTVSLQPAVPSPGPSFHEIVPTAMQLLPDDMEDTKTRKRRGMSDDDPSEFGMVRIISKPAPDAEDRLRRLFAILLSSSAGQAEFEKDSPPDDRHVSDHMEAEARWGPKHHPTVSSFSGSVLLSARTPRTRPSTETYRRSSTRPGSRPPGQSTQPCPPPTGLSGGASSSPSVRGRSGPSTVVPSSRNWRKTPARTELR